MYAGKLTDEATESIVIKTAQTFDGAFPGDKFIQGILRGCKTAFFTKPVIVEVIVGSFERF
jgi:hypothetical protein